jgi:hypothetical protein
LNLTPALTDVGQWDGGGFDYETDASDNATGNAEESG